MKKFLGIIVFGLLWCNVGVAEILKFYCESLNDYAQWIKYEVDTNKIVLRHL